MSPLQIWGGLECSSLRIGSKARDQLVETGHVERAEEDIELIARLGLKKLRYPVLWEAVERQPARRDWRWHDRMLRRLRSSAIDVIAGLIHHGSGPAHTSLLDPEFPELLATYAAEVARRYPWISSFTPINEPMTTARLAGLYGVWQPHARDERNCFRMVVAQCRAVARSMRAIRFVTPSAMLVQTEDIGRIFSTPALKAQAAYENDRRWLSLDLLAGRLDKAHPLYGRLLDAGVAQSHLAELVDSPCPPDLIGVDYYLTSDRFLDERCRLYPTEPIGGNGHQRYVDIAAARMGSLSADSRLGMRLLEVWERYRIPLAVTEIHNGSTREEQVRWLMDAVNEVNAAARSGVDVRALTSWALFGSYDWNSLLTEDRGYYEPGAFDVRGSEPRKTAVGLAVEALCRSGSYEHPVLDRPGWWRPDTDAMARILLISGHDEWAETVAQRCDARRLAYVRSPAFGPDIWARIHIRDTWGETKICASYSDGTRFELLMPAALERRHCVDAFLDLLVDETSGRFCLAKALAANQYKIAPAVPGLAQSRPDLRMASGR